MGEQFGQGESSLRKEEQFGHDEISLGMGEQFGNGASSSAKV